MWKNSSTSPVLNTMNDSCGFLNDENTDWNIRPSEVSFDNKRVGDWVSMDSFKTTSAQTETRVPILNESTKETLTHAKSEQTGKSTNFRMFLAPPGNEANVTVSKDSINTFHESFCHAVYGISFGKRVMYSVVDNYVKNTWSKFGLVK